MRGTRGLLRLTRLLSHQGLRGNAGAVVCLVVAVLAIGVAVYVARRNGRR